MFIQYYHYHPCLQNMDEIPVLQNMWWEKFIKDIQQEYQTISIGDSFLTRRDVHCQNKNSSCWADCETCFGPKIVREYGIVRTPEGWEGHATSYPKGEPSPFPFMHDSCTKKYINLCLIMFKNNYQHFISKYPRKMYVNIENDVKQFIYNGILPVYFVKY